MSKGIWTEICIHTSHEAIDAISQILHEYGASGVAIEDSTLLSQDFDSLYGEIYALSASDYPAQGVNVKAYLPDIISDENLIKELANAISGLKDFDIDYMPGTITTKQINEEDWANSWKQYYKPSQVTDRITVVPSWESYEAREDEIIIELDPGMAFGTGTHPTTRLAMINMDKYIKAGDIVYDVGCGSGVLSIAAAKLGAKQVRAFDLDPVAIKSCQDNVLINNVSKQVLVKENNLLNNVSGRADVIVANILAEIILLMLDEVPRHLTDKGYFICSGIIQNRERDLLQALEDINLSVIEIIREGEWVSLVCQKAGIV